MSGTAPHEASKPADDKDDVHGGSNSIDNAGSGGKPAAASPSEAAAAAQDPVTASATTPSSDTPLYSTLANQVPEGMTKNQWKRQLKYEKHLEKKRRKKEHLQAKKLQKAQEQGRDIAQERLEQEQNRVDGTGWAKRNERWQQHFQENCSKFQICIDCSFDDSMSDKEINSLASQLRYCYAENKKAQHPVKVTVTGLKEGGKTKTILDNVAGFAQWHHREFHHTEQDIDEAFSKDTSKKLVYLTSDSDNILEELQDDTVYIIGGIVDRNRLKRAAIGRAESLNIAHAKLPLSQHLHMCTTKVLTTNHVFNILLKWRECDKDWKKTLMAVLPHRKAAEEKKASESKCETKNDDNDDTPTASATAVDDDGSRTEEQGTVS